MNSNLVASNYWSTLVEYYYDNVHWKKTTEYSFPHRSINIWLKEEYDAIINHTENTIYFNDTNKMSWFLLRWS